ncbi:MAG: transglutaminase-like domain-containing protein [Candidatus Accumulibacter sp. UW26]
MKRRDFLAAAAATLSLLSPSSLLAANKKKSATVRSVAKPAGKSRAKPPPRPAGKSGGGRRQSERPVARPPAAAPVVSASPPPAAERYDAISLPDEPLPQWRTYDITSIISLHHVKGNLRLWLPLAQYKDTPWQRSLGHGWRGNFDSAGIYRDPVAEMEVFYADWKDAAVSPQLQLVSQVAKQDRHFDITRRGSTAERGEVLRRCLQATKLVPTDGLVLRTAEHAIGRIRDPVAQGKAIYDWVVENTSYDPAASGVGRGDIEAMLDSGQLSGKSADIALLFVGLCRAIGIPARPVFGLRVDASRLFAGLGATGNLRTLQHCRAEFYTPGYGWIPVDPGDVRKAIHEERLSDGDPKLVVLRKLLFGFWEKNWIAFNCAQEVRLQGASGGLLPFLVLPQAEAAGIRFDSLDPQRLSYAVTAQRVDG